MQNDEIIRIEHLGKIFSSGKNSVVALEDINLSINRGEIFGVIGLSGAGKSTLVRCINLLEKPTSGRVLFEGTDLASLSTKELLKARRSISMIFQGFNLLMQSTALENICFPMKIAGIDRRSAEKRADELLEIVGLSDKRNAYPSQLSGGQKQRVAIARALATDPKVILSDESTSALDPTTTRQILALLKEINEKTGVTVVVITHEMKVIEEICTRVAIIDQSRIAEVGPVKEVFLSPKSDIARRLVLPSERFSGELHGTRCLRVVFDGNSSFEPVVANMVLSTGEAVNILYASTQNIDGKAYGQMLLQLPDDPSACARMKSYLDSLGITNTEETDTAAAVSDGEDGNGKFY